jgi:ATP-dependent DNA helicase RecG
MSTEILAKQHYDTFLQTDFGMGQKAALLTSQLQLIAKEASTPSAVRHALREGTSSLLFGTHAVLNKKVQFKRLGLVVIDEQHRFGVEQRATLLQEPKSAKTLVPHLLSMTATPIPRTLALSVYGDLSLSTLRELPRGRQPIKTTVVNETDRSTAYAFIQDQLTQGRQAFIITPLVEESERLAVKSAKLERERLQKTVFPTYSVGLLYGGMKGAEKEAVMKKFNEGSIHILVATSVIEIGIDVPNATVILIEGADRFGLAQLHQLRGRVGRGVHSSYCMLFSDSQNEETNARLQRFSQTTDGFALAEIDLAERGFGSMFGNKQTGYEFTFSQFLSLSVLQLAKRAAEESEKENSTVLRDAEIQAGIKNLLQNIHLE